MYIRWQWLPFERPKHLKTIFDISVELRVWRAPVPAGFGCKCFHRERSVVKQVRCARQVRVLIGAKMAHERGFFAEERDVFI